VGGDIGKLELEPIYDGFFEGYLRWSKLNSLSPLIKNINF